MFLSIRNQISEEIKLLDRITVEHNQSEFFFVLSSFYSTKRKSLY
jgi:hypothetical protein